MVKRKLTKTTQVTKKQKTSLDPEKLEQSDNDVNESDDTIDDVEKASNGQDVTQDAGIEDDNSDDDADDDDLDAKPDVTVEQTVGNVGEKHYYNKPPSNEELNRLRETENLFHSTLFRLQISEILNEVKVKTKRFKVIDKAVEIVKDILISIEPMERYELQDHSWLKESKIKVPVKEDPKTLKGNFKFVPPEEVHVAGSYAQGTCIRQNMSVDLILTMPKKFFQPKDHLNHRYIRKRALYLCKVASVLNANHFIEDVMFTYLHGNHFKPVLVCTVKVEESKSVKLQLHAVPETGVFTLNKFHITKNNVRSGWFQEDGSTAEIPPENDVPTPFYNCTLLEDTLATDEKLADRIEACSSGVKEGIILLKIWLRQRELDMGFGGFSGHIMTMYVLYLLSKRKLNQQMSSYQIMRNTLLKLQDADWTTDGISLCFKTDDSNMPLLSEFHKHFGVVFVDPSGFLNLCYAMNSSTFYRVRHEALIAMRSLEDKSIDSFDRLFMKQVPFCNKFDHIFHIHERSSFESCVDKFGLRPAQYLDYGRHAAYACLPNMLQVLRTGLDKRVTLIQSQQNPPPTWKIKKNPPDQGDKLTFGLMLDSDFAFNVLDRGPSADKPETADFRKFWGEKSDLRRFQDGGICEAVLWVDSKKTTHKHMVCRQIVKFILQRHCGIKSSLETPTVQYIGDQLNSVLSSLATRDENAYVMAAYDDLCKILRKLDDLPLTVLSVQGVSPCFRYTEVFPPPPCTFKHKEKKVTTNNVHRFVPQESSNCPVYIPALRVICTMESSGKWPEDVNAMKRLKTAFLVQMADMIQSKYNLPVRVSTAHIDVLKDNYVFRLVPAYSKEIDLLRTIKTGDGMRRKRDTLEALALEKEIITLPKLTSTLHGIQQTHTSFSTTVRLAKRWISSHMLGDFIEQEALELIVTYLYLSPTPYTPPKSGLVGFQRFLELLSTFDWNTNPLIVNLNSEFTDEDLQEISTRFSEKRIQLPLMFISTPQSMLTSHWTVSGPTAPILHRLVLLAQKSLEVIQQQIYDEPSIDMKQIFRAPLDLYDVLFELNMDFVAQAYHQVDVSSHIRQGPVQSTNTSKSQDCFPVTDFNPVQMLLKEIRESFDDVCMVFHDEFGGSVIGLVWKPEAFQTKEFKISAIHHTMLKLEDGNKPALLHNTESIIEDIQIMAGDLITNVTWKQH